MSEYQATVELPSKGIPYSDEDHIPDKITLRSMTTNDEKIIYGSSDPASTMRVLKNCIVKGDEDDSFELSDLINEDQIFLLTKLRILSYGSGYHLMQQCPACGRVEEYSINLDKIPVVKLTKAHYYEGTHITLPRSNDKLTLQMMTGRLLNVCTDEVQKRIKIARADNISLDYDELMFIYSYAYSILSVEGRDDLKDDNKLLEYYSNMNSMDAAYMRSKLDGIMVGISSNVPLTCPNCGESFLGEYRMSDEFFHPRFD